MVVGGIGYLVNISAYWVLLKVFRVTETTFFGQHFYLPPFVVSSLLAIVSNYQLNKIWTFRGWNEASGGFFRYLSMALATLILDMAALWGLVDWVKANTSCSRGGSHSYRVCAQVPDSKEVDLVSQKTRHPNRRLQVLIRGSRQLTPRT